MSDEQHVRLMAPDPFADRPSPARMWNYLLGGKDYRQIDRDVADAMADGNPDVGYCAGQIREFLTRSVQVLAREIGIRQVLDLGCGLPAPTGIPNVHEIVQHSHPGGRVVYVDNDRVVLTYARALLAPVTPAGVCAYLDSDVRDIDAIVDEAARTLDFSEPVGVIMLGILGAIEYDEACRVAARVIDAIPAGSHLVFEDGVDTGRLVRESSRRRHESGVDHYQARTLDQMRSYLTGLEILEPGLVTVTAWRPDPADVHQLRPVDSYGCVARKP